MKPEIVKKERLAVDKTIEGKAGYVFALSRSDS
jgi:hypothetical protein